MTDTTSNKRDAVDASEIRSAVRQRYGRIAETETGCCGPDIATESTTCCGSETSTSDPSRELSKQLGYADEDLDAVVDGANLNLGCGNPTAIAGLNAGETVLDLGSGGGFDCFLAAREVGSAGQVIGVDMTPEMVERARENAQQHDAVHVEFRLGEIEHLPVPNTSVDVIISNCVINLSPNKQQVFHEAYRVLRPGGRLAISDVVLTAELPADIRVDLSSVAGCVGGAASIPALEGMLHEAGFGDVAIEPKSESAAFIREWSDDHDLSDYLVSATIEGKKPVD